MKPPDQSEIAAYMLAAITLAIGFGLGLATKPAASAAMAPIVRPTPRAVFFGPDQCHEKKHGKTLGYEHGAGWVTWFCLEPDGEIETLSTVEHP